MNMSHKELNRRRKQLDEINLQLLDLFSKRAHISKAIGQIKEQIGLTKRDAVRENEMIKQLLIHNKGPMDNETVKQLFEKIFHISLQLQQTPLLISRRHQSDDTVIDLKPTSIGGGTPVFIAGPCSVESYDQVRQIATSLRHLNVPIMRGGAFKPRTSPYDFQGLGIEGLKILKEVATEFGLKTVSEIVDAAHISIAHRYIDIIQIGSRNMHNFELLKAAGQADIPVLLKRGLCATLDEWMHAAEYIVSQGNRQVILIERGIRTYETATRNTLDISAIPILKQETHLPVLVDVSHSTGRKNIFLPCAKAALAAGADGLMVEVHPNPAVALSDVGQQLDLEQFEQFFEQLKKSGLL